MSWGAQILSFIMSLIISIQASLSLPILSINFKFDTDSAVFESGDDMYTVMWTTTRPGSGYVTYTYDGEDYTVYDQIGGNIRSTDTVHSVRVPKEHLDNNEYAYHSQYIGRKTGYGAVKGKTINSKTVEFAGYHGESEIKAMVIADVHNDPNPFEKAMKQFGEKPSIIILDGDISSTMVSKDEFVSIIKYAHQFSDGKIPVAYVRGNHEPRGEFASDMLQYFRTTTGGLYYTFNYGPLWSVVLDAGEDKEDDHREYSGLVNFRKYIADETKWLKTVKSPDSPYQLALSHKPELDDLDGNQWQGLLKNMGIDAVVSGHLHTLNLHYNESAPFYQFVTGRYGDYGAIATMLTFAGKNINAKTYSWSGTLLTDDNFPITR